MGFAQIKLSDKEDWEGFIKKFLENIGYSRDDIDYEEEGRRIFLKNGKTIRTWGIDRHIDEDDIIYAYVDYSIFPKE